MGFIALESTGRIPRHLSTHVDPLPAGIARYIIDDTCVSFPGGRSAYDAPGCCWSYTPRCCWFLIAA